MELAQIKLIAFMVSVKHDSTRNRRFLELKPQIFRVIQHERSFEIGLHQIEHIGRIDVGYTFLDGTLQIGIILEMFFLLLLK